MTNVMWTKILLANWRWIVGALVVGVLYWKASNWYDDYQDMKETYNRNVQQLLIERNNARVEAESAKAALLEIKRHDERLELLLKDAIQRQDVIRKETREQQKIFERHDFQALTEAKPGLIERLANRATEDRFNAFEDAFNGGSE